MPPSARSIVGGTVAFEAIGAFSDGSIRDLTEEVDWTSDDDAIAIVSSSPPAVGLATARASGAVGIGASDPATGIASLPASLEVIGTSRLFVDGGALDASGAEADVSIVCHNVVTVLGFSVALRYDPASLEVVDAGRGEAASSADYFEAIVDPLDGSIAVGCVWDLDGDFSTQHLAAGVDRSLIHLTLRALGDHGDTATLSFETIPSPGNPAVSLRNALTDGQGRAFVPELEHATLHVLDVR